METSAAQVLAAVVGHQGDELIRRASASVLQEVWELLRQQGRFDHTLRLTNAQREHYKVPNHYRATQCLVVMPISVYNEASLWDATGQKVISSDQNSILLDCAGDGGPSRVMFTGQPLSQSEVERIAPPDRCIVMRLGAPLTGAGNMSGSLLHTLRELTTADSVSASSIMELSAPSPSERAAENLLAVSFQSSALHYALPPALLVPRKIAPLLLQLARLFLLPHSYAQPLLLPNPIAPQKSDKGNAKAHSPASPALPKQMAPSVLDPVSFMPSPTPFSFGAPHSPLMASTALSSGSTFASFSFSFSPSSLSPSSAPSSPFRFGEAPKSPVAIPASPSFAPSPLSITAPAFASTSASKPFIFGAPPSPSPGPANPSKDSVLSTAAPALVLPGQELEKTEQKQDEQKEDKKDKDVDDHATAMSRPDAVTLFAHAAATASVITVDTSRSSAVAPDPPDRLNNVPPAAEHAPVKSSALFPSPPRPPRIAPAKPPALPKLQNTAFTPVPVAEQASTHSPLTQELLDLLTHLHLTEYKAEFLRAGVDFPALNDLGRAHSIIGRAIIPLPERLRFLCGLVAHLATKSLPPPESVAEPAAPSAALPSSLEQDSLSPPSLYVSWLMRLVFDQPQSAKTNFVSCVLYHLGQYRLLPYLFTIYQRFAEQRQLVVVTISSPIFVCWHAMLMPTPAISEMGAFQVEMFAEEHRDAVFAIRLCGIDTAPHFCHVCRLHLRTPASPCVSCRPYFRRKGMPPPVPIDVLQYEEEELQQEWENSPQLQAAEQHEADATPTIAVAAALPSSLVTIAGLSPASLLASAGAASATTPLLPAFSSANNPGTHLTPQHAQHGMKPPVTAVSSQSFHEREAPQAVEDLMSRAALGNANAQFELGSRYEQGKGLAKDKEIAAKWFRAAAEQGHGRAQIHLGYFLERGIGVTRNMAECIRYYKLAADQGYSIGQRNYALMLTSTGQHDEAIVYMKKAADQDEPDALCDYGLAFFSGKGVARDVDQAIRYLQRSSRLGHARSQCDLATIYFQQPNPDMKKVAQLYAEAAQQGYIPAVYRLAVCFTKGIGVDRNLAMALRQLTACAAARKSSLCAYGIAKLWFTYNYGDPQKALTWLHTAALDNFAKASTLLARLLLHGRPPHVERDIDQGIKLLRSVPNYVPAVLELARCYETGLGVERSRAEAYTVIMGLDRDIPWVAERLLTPLAEPIKLP